MKLTAYNREEEEEKLFAFTLLLGDAEGVFIAAAQDDPVASVSSAQLYLAWKAAGRNAELHLYSQGGHGFGMTKRGLPVDSWVERFGEWLKLQGYLKKLYPNKYEQMFGEEGMAKMSKQFEEEAKVDFSNLKRYKMANSKVIA